jgi:obg-like ATPase 1
MPPKKGGVEEEKRQITLGRPGNNVKIGIVGLPNVGKSSFFNTLSRMNVPAENFPFCTIDPNVAIVQVPDLRFRWLCETYRPASEVPPVLTITDIAGLVRGANEGAGLGNEFLSHIGATDAIYQVLRAFDDPDIIHVEGEINPVRDIGIINDELLLKDIAIIQRAMESMARNVERGTAPREKQLEYQILQKILEFMQNEHKAVRFGVWAPNDIDVLNRYQLLTAKEIVYLVNLSKNDYLRKKNRWLVPIQEAINANGGGTVIPFSVQFEQEWIDMELAGSLQAYKEENPNNKSAIPRILKAGYHALSLIHFFTAGRDEVKAWTIREGRFAPQAAGVIHTDFERGFIAAEVMAYDDLKELGSEEAVKKAGKYRMQGKKYVVQDGDIILFKFNV